MAGDLFLFQFNKRVARSADKYISPFFDFISPPYKYYSARKFPFLINKNKGKKQNIFANEIKSMEDEKSSTTNSVNENLTAQPSAATLWLWTTNKIKLKWRLVTKGYIVYIFIFFWLVEHSIFGWDFLFFPRIYTSAEPTGWNWKHIYFIVAYI